MIEGVEFNNIISHVDTRGFFREIIRTNEDYTSEGVSQISHSLVYSGVIKAWHSHKNQTQWNYILNGLIFVALIDLRINSKTYKESMTFLAGEYQNTFSYKFPPGIAHGYKCLNGPMNIIYFTSGVYDLNDEIRIDINDNRIDFDWDKITPIK